MMWGSVQINSFACRDPIFPILLIEETTFQMNGLGARHSFQKSIPLIMCRLLCQHHTMVYFLHLQHAEFPGARTGVHIIAATRAIAVTMSDP